MLPTMDTGSLMRYFPCFERLEPYCNIAGATCLKVSYGRVLPLFIKW